MNRLDEIRKRVKNICIPYFSHWDNPENTRKAYSDDVCFLLKEIDSLQNENEDLAKLSGKMNVCDLVKENLRLSNTIRHMEADNNFLQSKVDNHAKSLEENGRLKESIGEWDCSKYCDSWQFDEARFNEGGEQ